MEISQKALREAYAEIEDMRRKKQVDKSWPDELFNFVSEVIGNPLERRQGKISFAELAIFLNEKGWYTGSRNALSQAFKKERLRRQKGE